MTENNDVIDNRLHIRLKRHFLKHGKKLHAHIKKHHKKYIFWSSVYGISHIVIIKALALKLLVLKIATGGLAFVGIVNPSLTDVFAKMENVCIDNHAIIAQQSCEKNFATIQDAIKYLESTIDPETDTIYNAQYYTIIKSMLGKYCDSQIDKNIVATETKKINDINKQKESSEKIHALKSSHDTRKKKSLEDNLSGEQQFCDRKYLAYDMLDLSQSLFLKELRKQGLLSPKPIVSGQKMNSAPDIFVLSAFGQRKENTDVSDIHYTLEDLGNTGANTMAHIIKNISTNAVNNAINALRDMNILTDKEKTTIKDKLELRFVTSCESNKGYHKINQYYSDRNILQNTTLEEIKLDIPLCDSYQYIDQLDIQVKKLIIHEIGHYMYYFKDMHASTFETLCRSTDGKTKTNACKNNGFVSAYSQTNTEEDYAETFSRWALTKISKDTQYLAYYRDIQPQSKSGATISNEIIMSGELSHKAAEAQILSGDNILFKKFNYFDTLLMKSQKGIK